MILSNKNILIISQKAIEKIDLHLTKKFHQRIYKIFNKIFSNNYNTIHKIHLDNNNTLGDKNLNHPNKAINKINSLLNFMMIMKFKL